MRYTWIHAASGILLLLLASSPQDVAAQNDNDAFKVMSYNIRTDTESDGDNKWHNRRQFVVDLIRNVYAVDIFGIQEAVPTSQMGYLTSNLTDYAHVGVGRGPSNGTTYFSHLGEHNPIFYRTDRFEVVEGTFQTRWLSPTPDVPGSFAPGAEHPRIVTQAKFLDKQTGGTFWFFNTHFEHGSTTTKETVRNSSATLLAAWVAEVSHDAPVIITGDFNAAPTTTAVQTLLNSPNINNALTLSETPHQGPTGTNGLGSNWTNLPSSSRQPIDYILVSDDIRVLDHLHATDMYFHHGMNRFPSDHLPVIATVVLPEVIPEPGTLALTVLGGVWALRWSRKRGRHDSGGKVASANV